LKHAEEIKINAKIDKLRKMQIIQQELLHPSNIKLLIKLIIANLFHSGYNFQQLEQYYHVTIPRTNAKLYIDELSKLCDEYTLVSIFGRGAHESIKQQIMKSPVKFIGNIKSENHAEIKKILGDQYENLKLYLRSPSPLQLGNLTSEQVEYYLGSEEFNRLLYPFDYYNAQPQIKTYTNALTAQKEASNTTRRQITEKLFRVDEEITGGKRKSRKNVRKYKTRKNYSLHSL